MTDHRAEAEVALADWAANRIPSDAYEILAAAQANAMLAIEAQLARIADALTAKAEPPDFDSSDFDTDPHTRATWHVFVGQSDIGGRYVCRCGAYRNTITGPIVTPDGKPLSRECPARAE